jgi:hypothetical protein
VTHTLYRQRDYSEAHDAASAAPAASFQSASVQRTLIGPKGQLSTTDRVTQRASFHLCQRGIPVNLRPIRTLALFWRGQDMLYLRPDYAVNHSCY